MVCRYASNLALWFEHTYTSIDLHLCLYSIFYIRIFGVFGIHRGRWVSGAAKVEDLPATKRKEQVESFTMMSLDLLMKRLTLNPKNPWISAGHGQHEGSTPAPAAAGRPLRRQQRHLAACCQETLNDSNTTIG